MKCLLAVFALFLLAQAEERIQKCPDGQSFCLDKWTCCQMASGQYGCCPLENAFCCSDNLHCCPHGSHCDDSFKECIQDSKAALLGSTPSFTKIAAFRFPPEARDEKIVRCPDGHSACFDGMTCCQLPSGQYGCCPLPNAFCCDDHLHCCPSGSHCDPTYTQCIQKTQSTPSFTKIAAFQVPKETQDPKIVRCPDGHSACFDGMTCCQLPSGQYGCCPLPNAFCCDDHLHCCPSGSHCDPTYTQCIQKTSTSSVPAFLRPAGRM